MNIFWLALTIDKCVEYHCDKHVVKMILEYTQLLYSAHHVLGTKTFKCGEPYRLTHKNHPCAVWVRQTSGNYRMLYNLLKKLCSEYTYRYEKIHACESHVYGNLKFYPRNISRGTFTLPPMAMPVACKTDAKVLGDVVKAYQTYYKTNKSHIAQWKKREEPTWYKN